MVDNCVVKLITIASTALILSGCSYIGVGKGEFSCPSGIDGVRCMSARQVYQATESSDYVKTQNDNDKSSESPKMAGPYFGQTINSQVAVPSIEQPIPIRTQAKVMRIWMAPWEDDDGDLHADGYLYTEIESRKWNLGGRFKSPGTAILPLTVQSATKKR